MPPKRPASDIDDDTPSEGGREVKKQKTAPHRRKLDKVLEDFRDLLSPTTDAALAKFNKREEKKKNRDGVNPIDIDRVEDELEELRVARDSESMDAKLEDIDLYLKGFQDECTEYIVNTTTAGTDTYVVRKLNDVIWRINKAREQLPRIKATLLSKPPPSEYAKKTWVEEQARTHPMLCMRPVSCRGLPISLLHPVFATYLSLSKKTLPATPEANTALDVARELCNNMANHFPLEPDRRTAFLRATKPLFSEWTTDKEHMSQGIATFIRTDTTISTKGTTIALIEMKNHKDGGEVYMQVCRGYEITTEELVEKNPHFLKHGAPAFLLCLNDEELRISGAVKDGEQVVVEPLSFLLLYPDSREDGRMIQLARHLFALYFCLVMIAKEIHNPTSPPAYTFGCPRVFPKVLNTVTNQEEELEFKRVRKDLWETNDGTIDFLNLIFDATLGGVKVFAKVVLRSYGTDVHAHLADRAMAPRLYGTSSVQVASVIVMGLLGDGWTTLFNYRENMHRNGIPEPRRSNLLKRLEEILDCLGAAGMVHGDFRMANVMLKPGEEEKAMLIDFDWAGEAGKVRYPITRSRGFGYPGIAGGPIDAMHDRKFYEKWKGEI